jgi:hypothetical protein
LDEWETYKREELEGVVDMHFRLVDEETGNVVEEFSPGFGSREWFSFSEARADAMRRLARRPDFETVGVPYRDEGGEIWWGEFDRAGQRSREVYGPIDGRGEYRGESSGKGG